MPDPVLASALVASGLAVSTRVCTVVLLSLLLLLTSAKDSLSPVAGVAEVILFGFIVALVGTVGHAPPVVVWSSVSVCVLSSTDHIDVVVAAPVVVPVSISSHCAVAVL